MSQEAIVRLIADGLMIPIVLFGAYALIFKVPKGKRLKAYSMVLAAGLTTYLLAKLIGVIYQPEALRPFEQLHAAAGASFLNNPGFPSDHTLFATFITTSVWFVAKQKKLAIILAILTVLVGVGRVLALVHTPADVIGGIVIALYGSIWYLQSRI